ncbi:MAG: PAS domain S-box protein [Syntrophales bacterium]|nr:PAS domain S-box protein [Syntrophales bacterium]
MRTIIPPQKRIAWSILFPVLALGIIVATLSIYYLTPPLIHPLEENMEAELRLATSLGITICEAKFHDLLEMRLEDDGEMMATMRKEALEEIKKISAKLPNLHILVLGANQVLEGASLDLPPGVLGLSVLPRTPEMKITEDLLQGEWIRLHHRYFPLWKWQIVSFIYEKDYLRPIMVTRAILYLGTMGVFAFLVLTVFLVFNWRVTKPLKKIIDATEVLAQGNFQKLSLHREDEIGQVAQAFNSMVDSLEADQRRIHSILEALRDSEERYRLLTEYSLAIILIIEKGHIIYVNKKAIENYGYTLQELLGIKVLEIIAPEDRTLFEFFLGSLERGELPMAHKEVRWLTKGGETRWLEMLALPIHYQGRQVVLGHALDINDKKVAELERAKLENQLRQSQKLEAIGTLAGGIAHDFNNILAAIQGNVELSLLCLENGAVPGEVKANLQEILQAGKRAQTAVRQILTFTRSIDQQKEQVQVRQILKEVLNLIRVSLPTTIEVRTRINEERGTVLADPTQIHQVIMNLCTNAYQAMQKRGGVLEVSLDCVEVDEDQAGVSSPLAPGSYLQLVVRDNGQGMEPQVLERIFDPYFTTKKPGEGTGLGLAVVHGIVSRLGGAILVDSKLGEGSSFQVYLPRLENDAAAKTEEEAPPTPGQERILYVEDEAQVAEVARRLLTHLGYEVTVLTNSRAALELFHSRPQEFDLVITDLTMPQMTGLDLAADFIKMRPELPIILCSGYSDTVSPDAARQLGIREFLVKPVTFANLARAIRRALDGQGQDRTGDG